MVLEAYKYHNVTAHCVSYYVMETQPKTHIK